MYTMKIKAKKLKTDIPEYAIFLRQARSARKMTLSDVAKRIGISYMAMSHYELGRREPNLSKFEKWLKVFGLKLVIELENKGRK